MSKISLAGGLTYRQCGLRGAAEEGHCTVPSLHCHSPCHKCAAGQGKPELCIFNLKNPHNCFITSPVLTLSSFVHHTT